MNVGEMPSKKVIIPIIIAIILVIAGTITAGCVSHSVSLQDSSDTSPPSIVIVDADPGIDDSIAFFLETQV